MKWLFILHYLPFFDYLNAFFPSLRSCKSFALSEKISFLLLFCIIHYWLQYYLKYLFKFFAKVVFLACFCRHVSEWRKIHAWSNFKKWSWKGICYSTFTQDLSANIEFRVRSFYLSYFSIHESIRVEISGREWILSFLISLRRILRNSFQEVSKLSRMDERKRVEWTWFSRKSHAMWSEEWKIYALKYFQFEIFEMNNPIIIFIAS